VSESEERYPGWVLEYPGRATRWVKAARILIVPKAADVPIYLRWGGGQDSGQVLSAFPIPI
jgi:hypothetical protein